MPRPLEQSPAGGRLDPQKVAKARHDLRNPLGHIMGFAELLLERAKQQQVASAIQGLQELVSASEQILDEINHCLDPRRIESGQASLASLQASVQRFCRRAVVLGSQAEHQLDGEKVREDVRCITDSAARMETLGNELVPALEAALAAAPGPVPSLLEPGEPPVPAARAGSELIGLSSAPGEDQDRLLEALRASGYQVRLLGPDEVAAALLAGEQLDVLLIELDLERAESARLLENLKNQTVTTRLPVMVLARSPSAEGVRRALHAGAQDVLRYPLQDALLLARMGSILAVKRLHDQERTLLRRIAAEQQRTDEMVRTLLPAPVALRLRRGERFIADQYPDSSVLAADFGGLSRWASAFSAEAVVRGLSEVIAGYDVLCQRFSVPAGRVFGDSYQVVVGVPEPASDHVEMAAELALAMQREALPLRLAGGRLLRVRIGLHCGPVCGGLIGDDRLCFEVWGEAVDLARMLRNQAPPGGILTSRTMAAALSAKYVFERAPALRLDDTRELETRLLLGKVPAGE